MTRSDNEPGYIYLIEALGYHGILSPVVKRCKIGLSRSPEARRETFVKSQFPCDVKILKTIFVEDMAEVEGKLHEQFDFCNVELEKSREWFDLSPWQYLRVRLALITNEVHVFSFSELPLKSIAASVFLIFAVGIMSGSFGYKFLTKQTTPNAVKLAPICTNVNNLVNQCRK